MNNVATTAYADTIDLADIGRGLRRGWRVLAACLIVGTLAAAAVMRWAPRRFEAPSSLVIRQSDAGSSLLSKIAGTGDIGSLVSGAAKGSLETEIAILTSRTLAGATIDSLQLKFYKSGKLLDHQDAITYFLDHLRVEKSGGDVVSVVYRAADSLTAARVPNTLGALYLERRRTTDRGVNAHRVDFLQRSIDSASANLSAAERNLRRQQETSGVIDPLTIGKIELERAGELRSQLAALQVEGGALDQLVNRVSAGSLSPRELAAYPTFIKSSAISQLLAQLGLLEADRQKLLATRTPQDPEVEAITQSIRVVEGQLPPIAQTYATSVANQRRDLQRQLDTLMMAVGTLPRNAEASGRLQRDVLRLGQIYAALQAQLVEARLAAITEGGDVRQLDVATPPNHPAFPKLIPTMAAGIGGGLLVGVLAALILSGAGRWARDPVEIERVTGLPAVAFDDSNPLLIGPGVTARTILVIPLDSSTRTEPVARRLAETAAARAINSTILDFTQNSGLEVNREIEKLEHEFGSVIVQLPPLTSRAAAAALRESRPVVLVASPPRIDKVALNNALGTLRRLEVPCAGIVLSAHGRAGVLNA